MFECFCAELRKHLTQFKNDLFGRFKIKIFLFLQDDLNIVLFLKFFIGFILLIWWRWFGSWQHVCCLWRKLSNLFISVQFDNFLKFGFQNKAQYFDTLVIVCEISFLWLNQALDFFLEVKDWPIDIVQILTVFSLADLIECFAQKFIFYWFDKKFYLV